MVDLEKLRRLAAERVVASEIADELGVSRQRVYQLCYRHKIDLARYHDTRRPKRMKPRIITGGVMQEVSCGVGGIIAELLAAADLMARKWQIFRPIVSNRGVDIVAIKDGKIITVEVRSARRKPSGALQYRQDTVARADHYALVITGEPVCYVPELPEAIDSQQSVVA